MTGTIIDFVQTPKENPYNGDVANLIEAGEGKALVLTVPVGDFAKTKLKFAKAANAAGKTARIQNVDDSKVIADKDGKEQGDVAITFTLTEKHAPRTRKNKSTAADTETASE